MFRNDLDLIIKSHLTKAPDNVCFLGIRYIWERTDTRKLGIRFIDTQGVNLITDHVQITSEKKLPSSE